ncbi:triphosphoribosyl-dephospho-CoA synthase [Chelatococcus sp. GCM10030263]|uniref:triphosphoribosyl-dephospho-CoA synthase n=1 Tax=Chelatococcus sp. GCM10030263 TaxID=3273387 RepID=UPI00360A39E6
MARALDSSVIARLYRKACLAELAALKPGNVHVFAEGHGMTVADFEASANASAEPLARTGARIGERVLDAVEATVARLGMNTNLGILLLSAPIAAAAERPGELRANLGATLDSLDVADAAKVYAAIRRASPGGLGRSESHDVAEPPRVTLREAMAAAAGRDRIARAYVTGFEDLFAVGLPALHEAEGRGPAEPWTVTAVYLAFLAAVPDSHIARKFGAETAERIRERAAAIAAGSELGPANGDALLAFDAELKGEGINPGTSADFTVATIFLNAVAVERKIGAESLAGGRGPG